MSRLRLKSFKLVKKDPDSQTCLKKCFSSQLTTRDRAKHQTSRQQIPSEQYISGALSKRIRHSHSRGYLSRKPTDTSNCPKNKELSRSKTPVRTSQDPANDPPPRNHSRSPSYNQLKKKRLLRDRKSRERLVKYKQLPPQAQQEIKKVIQSKGVEVQQEKIKKYIGQLESILSNLQEDRAQTDRNGDAVVPKSIKQNSKLGKKPTDSKLMRRSIDEGADLNEVHTVRVRNPQRKIFSQENSSEETSRQLVSQIIENTRKQNKLINLKEVRSKYKQMSPAKDHQLQNPVTTAAIEGSTGVDSTAKVQKERKFIRPYRTVSQQNKQPNRQIHTIVEQDTNQTPIDQPSNIRIDCSEIRQADKKQSFFSDAPSYLEAKKTKQVVAAPDKLLNLLEVDTIDLKRVLKSKEKKRQIQKWKKNFPLGFFQDVHLY